MLQMLDPSTDSLLQFLCALSLLSRYSALCDISFPFT